MRRSLWSKTIALLIAHALMASSVAFAQDASQTRPRRAQSPQPTPASANAPIINETTRLEGEPQIRIGLATDARSVTISTSGQLLNATEPNASPLPLAVSRVRLEARLIAPQPETINASGFRVEIAGLAGRAEAESIARDIREQTGEAAEASLDAGTDTWRALVGSNLSAQRAGELREQLEDAGFATVRILDARASQAAAVRSMNSNTVRPTVRTSAPTREVVAYSTGSSKLFSASAPITFASANEQIAPVRFNEKPYRGRLEVFSNPRGALTVVNVLSLEDYVRGVVPNELSPGGYPAIEALKAQAVAARTYAVRNRNQFASQGFDLLPTTRSQVYGGLSTEHPLSTRAVDETRGLVATYKGEAINALYTSTCGGRTEDVENIFNDATPYLRGRECSLEGRAHFSSFIIKSSRELPDVREESNAQTPRAAALLDIHGFDLGAKRLTDNWLAAPVSPTEVRNWLSAVARLARQSAPAISDDATRPPGFSTALAFALYGESRADTLLDNADVEYLLSFRDAGDIPERNRPDVAWLVRDGFLPLFPDASLHPREAMSRGRVLQAIARALEARGSFGLQKGTTRPAAGGAMILRSAKNKDQSISVDSDAYLFRAYGEGVYQMRSLSLVGGEPVTFHLNPRGEVDYLEVRPAPNGAAADRSSPYANWTAVMSVAEVQSKLARWSKGTGALTDLRVAARGYSRRVTDLAITGTSGTAHLRGGRIRSALGLREQLFVIDRKYDEGGRLTGFTFTGRGWGHGVGLCQVGAFGLARQGLTYDKILKAYYTGIDLTKLYN
ncbi:MAG TPA: SpoIID/LytB domain-containing protein [Pyrinomonadaceae bacterium]|nr:SpoIID/LytB domain-containing protein [Pyrinomonadaceae bacterium]